jgi:hypothetical protein
MGKFRRMYGKKNFIRPEVGLLNSFELPLSSTKLIRAQVWLTFKQNPHQPLLCWLGWDLRRERKALKQSEPTDGCQNASKPVKQVLKKV